MHELKNALSVSGMFSPRKLNLNPVLSSLSPRLSNMLACSEPDSRKGRPLRVRQTLGRPVFELFIKRKAYDFPSQLLSILLFYAAE